MQYFCNQNSTAQLKIKNMELTFNQKSTKVQQLSDFISQAIAMNEYRVGESLPSINHLSAKYKVSRDTVFKAFLDLKSKGLIDSVHGKSYFVCSQTKNILLLLDEYSPFKEVVYNTIIDKIPVTHKVDLWFHQYNEQLFNSIIEQSLGKYNKYLVMNYHNEKFSPILNKIDKKKLLLLDFGKFEKKDYAYICQDFDTALFDALTSMKQKLRKYKKLIFVFNRNLKHPKSSKEYFVQFCMENGFEFEIIEEITEKTVIRKNALYLIIKQEDVVKVIKQSRKDNLVTGKDFGIIAYNDNPFYEIIDNGIASISINWKNMGNLAANFITKDETLQTYLPTEIIERESF